MKIDEVCINHNVDKLIGEMTDELYERVDNDSLMAVSLAEIRRIHQLDEAIKEVLKA